jgi:hypothetical protein
VSDDPNPPQPPQGTMVLYDEVEPALQDGSYHIVAASTVGVATDAGDGTPLSKERHFVVDGPRFTLAPTEVALVHPPRNGKGAFHTALPQIALKRRTLPWERPLHDPLHDDPATPLPTPAAFDGLGPPPSPPPWLALLLFEADEAKVLPQQPLESVLDAGTRRALGDPQGIVCDAVEVDRDALAEVMPSLEELALLAHVRQVNVDDKELNAGSSDGFFAVLLSNRVPEPGKDYLACLVSLEERQALVPADPPAVYVPPRASHERVALGIATHEDLILLAEEAALLGAVGERDAPEAEVLRIARPLPPVYTVVPPAKERLVLLHSWKFTSAAGKGTFYEYMQAPLDVGMLGSPGGTRPQVLDTGHLRLSLQDRAGVEETVWYRGPLVPLPLTRDENGPYHSADQARRPTPETGVEDVSYAAAFEVGRLLAAADGRLAQELARWRREAYDRALHDDLLEMVRERVRLPAALLPSLPLSLLPTVATAMATRALQATVALADPTGLATLGGAPGLDPGALARAWGVNAAQAQQLLGGGVAALGAPVIAPGPSERPGATIDSVASDRAGLSRLQGFRDLLVGQARDAATRGGP